MDSDILHRFLGQCREVYYTNLFTLCSQLIAIITTLFFIKKENKALPFLIYSIAAFSIFLIADLFFTKQQKEYEFIRDAASVILACIEYAVFLRFFQDILVSSIIKKIMIYFLPLLTGAVFIFLILGVIKTLSNNQVMKFTDFITSTELIFLISLCLVYYFESIHKKTTSELKSSPSFWIVSGLFFYSIIIAPFFMITDEILGSNKKLYFIAFSVHYFSFGLLFLAITKAFLMRKPLTT